MAVERSPVATHVPVNLGCHFIAGWEISVVADASEAPTVIFSVDGAPVYRGTCFALPTGTMDYVRSIEDIGPLIVTLMNQHGMAS
jgi:hypothetical protein